MRQTSARRLTERLLYSFVLTAALLSGGGLGYGQDTPADDSLTKNLLSTSGPTFRVDAKELGCVIKLDICEQWLVA